MNNVKNTDPQIEKKQGEDEARHDLKVNAAIAFGIACLCAFLVVFTSNSAFERLGIAALVREASLFTMANESREDQGQQVLVRNPVLDRVAQLKANHMVAGEYFAHVSPSGVDPWHWFENGGYEYRYAGENLAIDFDKSADVHRAWMRSPTHRKNILAGKYTEMGLATAQGVYKGQETTYVVQVFARPMPGTVTALLSHYLEQQQLAQGDAQNTEAENLVINTQEVLDIEAQDNNQVDDAQVLGLDTEHMPEHKNNSIMRRIGIALMGY